LLAGQRVGLFRRRRHVMAQPVYITALGCAFSSAVAVHVTIRRWLSFLR
jgi:hypothetical protein